MLDLDKIRFFGLANFFCLLKNEFIIAKYQTRTILL